MPISFFVARRVVAPVNDAKRKGRKKALKTVSTFGFDGNAADNNHTGESPVIAMRFLRMTTKAG